MRTFELHRLEDETGISGTGIVAEGVEFSDGTCAMRWRTEHRSTTFYSSMKDVDAIHGHHGKTKIVVTGDPFGRGFQDAAQDACENAPFASIGGLDARNEMKPPSYITPAERAFYLDGYRAFARATYGADWKTCALGWQPALTINEPPPESNKERR